MALDALSKLMEQFSRQPNFEELIDVMLWTISGQFSVASAFAILQRPGKSRVRSTYFATGVFKVNKGLAGLRLSHDQCFYFTESRRVQRADNLGFPVGGTDLEDTLADAGVKILCPVVHNGKFMGLIGLGDRVSRKGFDDDDMDLLSTLVSAITPFIVNSHLFWQIANLNKWYLDILNSVQHGVFVFDENLRLRKANNAGSDMLRGLNPYLHLVKSLEKAPIELVFPDIVFENWIDRIRNAILIGSDSILDNMLVKTDESESIFNVRIGWSSADPDNGKDLIVTIDDVTRIKENEQRMFELQGFADKGIMASSIAHELNNFLALLMAGVEMTQLSIKRGDSGKTAVTLDKLMENVRKMKRFTMGLTDFGMLGSSMQNANLNDIITDVLSFVKVQKRFTRIKLTANLDFNLPMMLMDTDQMSQLLLNFLNNAADAIAGLGRTDGTIGLTTSQTDNLIILTVADNGSGIDPAIEDKLFKEQLTTKEGGHGFGLMTCARIVESHGGNISFKSAVGEGTTFRFEFPKEYDPE